MSPLEIARRNVRHPVSTTMNSGRGKYPVNSGSQQDLWSYNNRRSNTNSAFAEATVNGIHLNFFPQYNSRSKLWKWTTTVWPSDSS